MPGVVGVSGDDGVDGVAGDEVRLLLRRTVMLREMGRFSSTLDGPMLFVADWRRRGLNA